MLIDEIHTPDSSRYWLADTYEERHAAGQEPQVRAGLHVAEWACGQCWSL